MAEEATSKTSENCWERFLSKCACFIRRQSFADTSQIDRDQGMWQGFEGIDASTL